MGLLEFAADAGGVASGINSVIGAVQSGYNLYKDINNIDIERQRDAQIEINKATQAQQYEFNKQLAEQAHGYNLGYMDKQQAFNAEQLMKQYQMNSVLSNAARSAMQQRAVGINPTQSAGSSTSVGLPTSQAPSQSASQVGSPSSSVVPSHYTPSNSTGIMDYLRSQAEIRKTDTENRLLRIEELYRVSDKITALMETRSRIEKNLADAHKSDAETKSILGKYDDEIEVLKQTRAKLMAEEKYYSASATKAQKEGDKAVSDAKVNQKQQEETARHNRVVESQEWARVKCERERVNYEMDVANAQVEQLQAAAERDLAEGRLTKEKAEWYGAQIFSEIYKNLSLSAEAQAKARLENMTADEYKAKVASEIARNYAQAAFYGSFTLKNVIQGIANAMSFKGGKGSSISYGKKGYKAPDDNRPGASHPFGPQQTWSDYGTSSW